MSTLYIIGTPIGNLEDITFRAIQTLKEVDFIIAEDTRHSKILLNRYEIETPLKSFHAQSSREKAKALCEDIKKGKSAAYISDAGTPCISDPGFVLVQEAHLHGIDVIPIPGASALTTFLSVVGMPVDSFVWHGFLSHKKGRQTIITSWKESKVSHLCYESVHRIPKLLNEIEEHLGASRVIGIGRELTKMHEEIFRGTIQEAQQHFNSQNTKGEFIVLIAPHNFTLS